MMLESLKKPIPAGLPGVSTPPTARLGRPGLPTSVLNVALYQAGWFGCVLAAGAGRPVLALLSALGSAAIHLLLVVDRKREASLLAAAALLGLVFDTATLQLGVLWFPAELGFSGIAPLWIVAMWTQFGMTFHYCLSWLSGRYVLSAVLGMVGGPLSFLGGSRLGAVEILEPLPTSLAVLGLFWAVAMALLVALSDRLAPPSGGRPLYRFETAFRESREASLLDSGARLG